jgi:hypothetical protein
MKRLVPCLSALLLLSACESPGIPEGQGEIRIVNQSTWRIRDVYIKGCTESSWGPDELTASIGPNISLGFNVDPGCHDVRTISEFGGVLEFHDRNVAAGQSISIAYP